MYSTTTSRGRTSVSPTPSGGGRRSTRAARGSTSSRRARNAASKSGYNASSPYGSSLSSEQHRDGLYHGQLNRRSEPARRWVKVMRPPAPHIKFQVAKWVPLKDLTEEEREDYQKHKLQQQEEKQRQDAVDADGSSSQQEKPVGMEVNEDQVSPRLATPAQSTPISSVTGQTDYTAPMAISPPPENFNNKRKLEEGEGLVLSSATPPTGDDATNENSSDDTKRRKLNEMALEESDASKHVEGVGSLEATPAASLTEENMNQVLSVESAGVSNPQQNEPTVATASSTSNPAVDNAVQSGQHNEPVETTANNQDMPPGST